MPQPRAPKQEPKTKNGTGTEPEKTEEKTSETGSEFLDAKLIEIRTRMEEIHPAVIEYGRLEAAERALAEGPPNRGGRPRKN